MTTTPPDLPAGTCCGQDGTWSPEAGAPIAESCRLCPASPTYFRRGRADGRPYEQVKPLSEPPDVSG